MMDKIPSHVDRFPLFFTYLSYTTDSFGVPCLVYGTSR